MVPSLEYIDATVVPEVCKELGLDDFVKTRSVVLGNCTLYLCTENMLDRGHRNNQIYLVLFPMPAFISKVDQLHTWSTLIVVASEDDASDWRSQNVVEDL